MFPLSFMGRNLLAAVTEQPVPFENIFSISSRKIYAEYHSALCKNLRNQFDSGGLNM